MKMAIMDLSGTKFSIIDLSFNELSIIHLSIIDMSSWLLQCPKYLSRDSGALLLIIATARLFGVCRWAAYLGALPKSFPGMPMFWTAEEVHALKGTALWKKSMGQGQLRGFHVEPPVQVVLIVLSEKFFSTVAIELSNLSEITEVQLPLI